jgi:hypothetical protein
VIALLRGLDARQPVLARTGVAMLLVLAGCLVAMAVDPREIRGVSVWVKPAKFAASLAIWVLTMAWAWSALAPAARAGWPARIIIGGTLAFGLFEVGWIALRAALGQPSHFAGDALGAAVYGLMGFAALVGCLLAAGFGGLVALRGNPATAVPMRLAVAAGFVIAGLGGAFTGFAIGANLGPYVGGVASDAGALAPFFWSRSGGDLRVAHFVAIHAMQAIPLLGWGLARAGATWPRAWIAAGSAAWLALAAGAFVQAQAGRAFI